MSTPELKRTYVIMNDSVTQEVLWSLFKTERSQGTRALRLRQAAWSRIIANAHRINQGSMPDWIRDPDSDFHFVGPPQARLRSSAAGTKLGQHIANY
jgi:hypothetical protein